MFGEVAEVLLSFPALPSGTPGAPSTTAAPVVDDHAREPREVFVACTVLVMVLVILWAAYKGMVQSGRDFPGFRLFLLCLSFAVCSWGMNVLNKSLVVTLGAPTLVTVAQMMMTVLGSIFFAYDKISFVWVQVFKWSCVPVLFFGMLVSSLFSFQYLTLSLLVVVRNVGPLVTYPIERAVMPPEKLPTASPAALVALAMLLVGAVVYCVGASTTFSWVGLGFALLNMVLAIGDRLAQRRLLTTECSGLSNETCVLLNNLLGLIPTLILGIMLKEVAKFDAALWLRSTATILLVMSGLVGSGICYFAIAVQREISATSFMVLQNAVRMAVVLAGAVIFGDPIARRTQTVGLFLSFCGALTYGHVQAGAAEEARRSAAAGERKKLLPK